MVLKIIDNPYRGRGIEGLGAREVSLEVSPVKELLALCPRADETPLVSVPVLAKQLGIGTLHIKDERNRMGLGSFKALGAAYVVASHAAEALSEKAGPSGEKPGDAEWKKALDGKIYVAASAGNHGLSLVAGARLFGAGAVIYLSKNVPQEFAEKLRKYGAEVCIEGNDYDESLQAARKAAKEKGWFLLSDTTWDGYDVGVDVMQGYLVTADEVCEAYEGPPTHIFLQAGVGGFAAAMAGYLRKHYGGEPLIIVVEPDEAPALFGSIGQGRVVEGVGGVTSMGRLDCKMPSLSALDCLSKTADRFLTLSDEDVEESLRLLEEVGLETSPSGGAGFAGLHHAAREGGCDLTENSRVIVFLSEANPKKNG